MADMTDQLANDCANRFLRGTAAGPYTAWVGFASAASDIPAGTIQEINANATTDYARLACGFEAAGTLLPGVTRNAADITFTESGAGYNAPITHVVIFSTGPTGGVPLLIKALGASKTIAAGDTPKISQFALQVTFD